MTANIFYIDDEPKSSQLFARLARKQGLRVSGFTDATTALAAFEAQAPDLVITDLKMPGMDGLTVLQELQQRDVLPLTYYMLLQDRITEAKQYFTKASAGTVQYDYMAAYLDMFNDQPKQARQIASRPCEGPAWVMTRPLRLSFFFTIS